MQTYTFTLTSSEEFSATVAISGTHSLYALAELLIKAVKFDFDHAFGFYDNLKNPYRSKEKYTLFADMGEAENDEPGVKATLIQDVFTPRKQFCFLFDYGDDWMFKIKCDSVEPASTTRKISKVLTRTGTPPEQYPDCEE